MNVAFLASSVETSLAEAVQSVDLYSVFQEKFHYVVVVLVSGHVKRS